MSSGSGRWKFFIAFKYMIDASEARAENDSLQGFFGEGGAIST